MNTAQKNRLRVLIQSLTENAVELGKITHEDDQDKRPESQRGSTHEMRVHFAKCVRNARNNIERLLEKHSDNRTPLLGTTVRLARDVERFPEFVAPEGLTGTVIENGSLIIVVKMDKPWEGCPDDRTIEWHKDLAGEEPLNAIFWEDVDACYIPPLTP